MPTLRSPPGRSKPFLLVQPRVRPLLDLQEHGILDHAEAVAAADHEHDVPRVQFARGHQFAVVVVDVNQAVTGLDDQHLGGAHQVALQGAVGVAGDLCTGRVDDVADLLLKFRGREEGGAVGQVGSPKDIAERGVLPQNTFD